MTDHPVTAPASASPEQPTASPDKIARYRFWLSFMALLVSFLFGFTGLGAFSAGEGLAGDVAAGADHGRVVLTFGIVGTILLTLAPVCLYLAWRFRPGGE